MEKEIAKLIIEHAEALIKEGKHFQNTTSAIYSVYTEVGGELIKTMIKENKKEEHNG